MGRYVMAGMGLGSGATGGSGSATSGYAIDGAPASTTIADFFETTTVRPGGDGCSTKIAVTSAQIQNIVFDPTSKGAQSNLTWTSGRNYFASFAFNFSALPTNATTNIFGWLRTGSTTAFIATAAITSAGKIRMLNQAGTQVGSDSTQTIATNTWYVLQSKMNLVTAGTNETFEIKLINTTNGTTETVATTTTGAFFAGVLGGFGVGFIGASGTTTNMFIDDVIMNDDQGASNNTYPDYREVIYCLRPISDNAVGSGWLNGGGAGTNLWDAVNNAPPAGVVTTSSTATSQIKNATSTTVSTYVANLETFSTKGITASDTITAIQAGCNTASSSTTSVNCGVSATNPTLTEVTDTSTQAAVTWPAGWSFGWPTTNIVDAPTPTLGTSPTITIRKATATTTTLNVSTTGMYVGVIKAAVATSHLLSTMGVGK